MSMFNGMFHDMMIQNLAESKSISLEEAKAEISKLSFSEYHRLSEANGTAIVPPSGNALGPKTSAQQNTPTTAPSGNIKSIWPGKGSPVEMGMTVGLKGPSGTPIPGEVTQVDASTNGVVVLDPTTGKKQTMNMDTLEPFMAGNAAQSGQAQQNITSTEESTELMRLRELAGIRENCSGGATGAGAIAVAPTAMGKMHKRQGTEEGMTKREYTREGPAKTIPGDTKPRQNSGQLSATLAANGKPTATRRKRK